MTITLVHDSSSESASLAILAREVGAKLDVNERDIPIIPLYICELLDQVVNTWMEADEQSPHPIRAIAKTFAWTYRQRIDDRKFLIWRAKDFSHLIHSIDDDDGWPTDRWLNGLLGCHIAMHLALEDPDRIRWPAEAGGTIYELVTRQESYGNDTINLRKSWLCARLLSARHKAKKMAEASP